MLTGLYPHQNGQIGLAHLGYSMLPAHEPRNLNPQRSIRDARYKLTVTLLKDPAFQWPAEIPLAEYRKIQRRAATGEFIELYDLKIDPFEFKNLAGQPEVQAEQERLLAALRQWRQETRDPLLDPGALRALVLKEKDAPPTPVPTWKKAPQKQGKPAQRRPTHLRRAAQAFGVSPTSPARLRPSPACRTPRMRRARPVPRALAREAGR